MPYYAVRKGRSPGIYPTWDKCKAQIDKFPKPRFKKFNTKEEALEFINGSDKPQGPRNMCKHTNQETQQLNPSPCRATSTDKEELTILKMELELKQKELEILMKQKEADDLREEIQKSKESLKATKKSFTTHRNTPYSRDTGPSSANWKQKRKTKLLDLTSNDHLIHAGETLAPSTISDPTHAEVYTDGACTNNGQKQPQAGIGVYWGPNHPLNISERLKGRQTNNRAEIHAVIRAVKQAQARGIKNLTVHTDSQFLIDSMTKWLAGWERNGWQTKAGHPVVNREDFECLLEHSQGIAIHWNHVRGHQGIPGNEAADKLAVAGANKPDVFDIDGWDSNEDF